MQPNLQKHTGLALRTRENHCNLVFPASNQFTELNERYPCPGGRILSPKLMMCSAMATPRGFDDAHMR